jgi:FeS assembly SUF system regulator
MAKDHDCTCAATELAERSAITPATVSKILKSLAKAGIVKSTRGAKGGYQLCKPPGRTTVASVIDALEGPIAITECGVTQSNCQQATSCHIRGNWNVINRAVKTALEAVTLIDMINPHAAPADEVVIPLRAVNFTHR